MRFPLVPSVLICLSLINSMAGVAADVASHTEQRPLDCVGFIGLKAEDKSNYLIGARQGLFQYAMAVARGIRRDISLFSDLLERNNRVHGEAGLVSDIRVLYLWHNALLEIDSNSVASEYELDAYCASPDRWAAPAIVTAVEAGYRRSLDKRLAQVMLESREQSTTANEIKLRRQPNWSQISCQYLSPGPEPGNEYLGGEDAYFLGVRDGVLYLTSQLRTTFTTPIGVPMALVDYWEHDMAENMAAHLSATIRADLNWLVTSIRERCLAQEIDDLSLSALALQRLVQDQRLPEQGVLVENGLYLPGGDDYYDEADVNQEGLRLPD